MTNVDVHIFRTRDGMYRARFPRKALPQHLQYATASTAPWAYTPARNSIREALLLAAAWMEA